jgi:hypothetical protein
MGEETAQTVLYAIAAVAFIVWLAGLLFVVASSRLPKAAPAERFELAGPSLANAVTGTAEIEGRPAELAAKAASILAKGNAGPVGPMKVLERADDRVVFEGLSLDPAAPSLGRFVRQGEIRFASAGMDRTRVDYRIDVTSGRGLLRAAAVVQLLGLIALVAGFWLIRTYIVPKANPGIRGQTFQMIQVVHFLWPPFLLAGLYRLRVRAVPRAFDALIHNLPYTSD